MRHIISLVLLGLTVSACKVGEASPPLTSGDGMTIAAGIASVDQSRVPVVPDCKAGQVIMRTRDGWQCASIGGGGLPECADGQVLGKANGLWACQTLSTDLGLQAGAGITVEGTTIAARFGTGATDVAAGNHTHDDRYRKLGDPLAWSDLNAGSIPSSAVWPGTIPYSSVTGAPPEFTEIGNQLAGFQKKIISASQSDASEQRLDNQNQKTISTFNFTNVPAGNVFVTMGLGYQIDSWKTNQCSISVSANGTAVASVFTHGSSTGNDAWNFRSLTGTLPNFAGGDLTILVQAWCDKSQVGVQFGNKDLRFGRQLTILAGL
jgi:hypothetical protein